MVKAYSSLERGKSGRCVNAFKRRERGREGEREKGEREGGR